jgi:aminoglycoside phosphotransferase (APT) family kinase protein
LEWFVDLGAATADTQTASPREIGEALTQLLQRFVDIYRPTSEQHDFLAQQIAKLGGSETAVPLVFQHGDPGPWNMLITPGRRVAVLDWEAAEAAGMPGWDLFYFMRSFSLDAARKLGVNKRLVGFKQQFLDDTALSRLYINTMARYCQGTGLDGRLIEPLFYTCWMHRALKESMRLEPAKLGQGHFVNLIWWCREHRDSATLSRLFSLPAEHSASAELLGEL